MTSALRRMKRVGAAGAAGVLAVGIVAACGSSSTSSSGSAATTATTAASSGTTAASTGSTAAPGGTNLASFQAIVTQGENALTTTAFPGPTVPVKAPTDVKLAIVECSTSTDGCEEEGQATEAAAKLLGWKTTIFNGNNDSLTQSQLIEDAVDTGFQAIVTTSIDPSLVAAGLRAAHAKGIPVGSFAEYAVATPTGIAFDVGANWVTLGTATGAWFVVHTGGKGTISVWPDKEFESDGNYSTAVEAEVRLCSTCTVAPEEDFVAANVGPSLGVRVANVIEKDPKIDGVEMGYDSAAEVAVSAIQQADLKNVTVGGNNGAAQDIGWIKNGTVQGLDGSWDVTYGGYAVVDQMSRLLAHQPLIKTPGNPPLTEYDENTPWALVDSTNVGTVKIVNGVVALALDGTLAPKFSALWGVSS